MMNKKAMAGLLAAAMLFGAAGGAYAGTSLKEIKAYLNYGIQFKVNGVAWQPKDTKGQNMQAITYQGNTYLPVRAVGEALKVAVGYDQASQTVLLGEQTDGTPITSDKYELSVFATLTKEKAKTVVNGVDQKEVFYVEQINSAEKGFTIYPNKKYQKLVLKAAAVKDDATLRVLNGSSELIAEKLTAGEDARELKIDIDGAEKLEIKFAGTVDTNGFGVVLASSHYK